jgi:hypothetical protein
MKNAAPSNYNVLIKFDGSASITSPSTGSSAQDGLKFNAFGTCPAQVLAGGVDLGRNQSGSTPWSGSISVPVPVTIYNKKDRVKIADYELTMNLNKCGPVTVTATGTITIQSVVASLDY